MYVCVRACVRVCARACVCVCVIIILREYYKRHEKNQKNCINYGSEVEENDITYLETSVCLCRDFDMVLAIFFLSLFVLAIFFIAKPRPGYFFKISSRPPINIKKWSLPKCSLALYRVSRNFSIQRLFRFANFFQSIKQNS